jgi:hypothetical protein
VQSLSPGLFDYPKSIERKEYIFDEDDAGNYNQFVINKNYSLHLDTVLLANEMNLMPPRRNKQHYDFLYYAVKKRPNRYSNWHKFEKELSLQTDIAELYNCSIAKANEIISVLTEPQLDALKEKLAKGGH